MLLVRKDDAGNEGRRGLIRRKKILTDSYGCAERGEGLFVSRRDDAGPAEAKDAVSAHRGTRTGPGTHLTTCPVPY